MNTEGNKKGTLIILTGATGIGKTKLAINVAQALNAPIISADSRQIYRELPIGTAAPTLEEMQLVPHYMVACTSIQDHYSAARYESEVIPLIERLLLKHKFVLLVGGSMLYLDAIIKGIDDIPDVAPEIRKELYARWEKEGLDNILKELKEVDPEYYEYVDKQNYKRVIHGLEIYLSSGKKFSSFRTNIIKERSFSILAFELTRPREELYNRINSRVEIMIEQGWIEEARKVYPFRELNSLNTIGYKELFAYFDGTYTLNEAKQKIAKNTRVYARKQITWFKKNNLYQQIPADTDCSEFLSLILN